MPQSVLVSAALYLLRLLAALLSFAVGGVKSPALDIVVDQFEMVGPRQGLTLLIESLGVGWSWRDSTPVAGADRAPRGQRARLTAANDNRRVEEIARAS